MSTCVIKFDPRTIAVETLYLDADARGVLFSLLLFMWSSEGHIASDDKTNAKRCGVRPSSYKKAMGKLIAGEYLDIVDGRLYPSRRIQSAMRRVALTAEQRAAVIADEKCCAYCGDRAGPFEVEHIFPASRGGTNHRRNLTLACFPCNMAKRDYTLAELAGGDV